MGDVENLLQSQLAYYRASADEMDAGIRRVLTTDQTEYGEQVRAATAEAVAWLQNAITGRDTLEIAAGTGMYTEHLAYAARRLTALDASEESLAINQRHARANGLDVEFLCKDVFTWEPHRRYEAVVFTFWLSHVPLARFEDFWATVETALLPGGVVVFADAPAAEDGSGPIRSLPGAPDIVVADRPDAGFAVRKLADGREFSIVRILWGRDDLRSRLRQIGWMATLPPEARSLLGKAYRS